MRIAFYLYVPIYYRYYGPAVMALHAFNNGGNEPKNIKSVLRQIIVFSAKVQPNSVTSHGEQVNAI